MISKHILENICMLLRSYRENQDKEDITGILCLWVGFEWRKSHMKIILILEF